MKFSCIKDEDKIHYTSPSHWIVIKILIVGASSICSQRHIWLRPYPEHRSSNLQSIYIVIYLELSMLMDQSIREKYPRDSNFWAEFSGTRTFGSLVQGIFPAKIGTVRNYVPLLLKGIVSLRQPLSICPVAMTCWYTADLALANLDHSYIQPGHLYVWMAEVYLGDNSWSLGIS